MISGLKYSVHNEHKKTRNFVKEWGFANLGDPMYILGGKQGFMLLRLMGLIGLFSQAVSVGCYKGSLGDMGLVGGGGGALGVLGNVRRYCGIAFSRGRVVWMGAWPMGPGVRGACGKTDSGKRINLT